MASDRLMSPAVSMFITRTSVPGQEKEKITIKQSKKDQTIYGYMHAVLGFRNARRQQERPNVFGIANHTSYCTHFIVCFLLRVDEFSATVCVDG